MVIKRRLEFMRVSLKIYFAKGAKKKGFGYEERKVRVAAMRTRGEPLYDS